MPTMIDSSVKPVVVAAFKSVWPVVRHHLDLQMCRKGTNYPMHNCLGPDALRVIKNRTRLDQFVSRVVSDLAPSAFHDADEEVQLAIMTAIRNNAIIYISTINDRGELAAAHGQLNYGHHSPLQADAKLVFMAVKRWMSSFENFKAFLARAEQKTNKFVQMYAGYGASIQMSELGLPSALLQKHPRLKSIVLSTPLKNMLSGGTIQGAVTQIDVGFRLAADSTPVTLHLATLNSLAAHANRLDAGTDNVGRAFETVGLSLEQTHKLIMADLRRSFSVFVHEWTHIDQRRRGRRSIDYHALMKNVGYVNHPEEVEALSQELDYFLRRAAVESPYVRNVLLHAPSDDLEKYLGNIAHAIPHDTRPIFGTNANMRGFRGRLSNEEIKQKTGGRAVSNAVKRETGFASGILKIMQRVIDDVRKNFPQDPNYSEAGKPGGLPAGMPPDLAFDKKKAARKAINGGLAFAAEKPHVKDKEKQAAPPKSKEDAEAARMKRGVETLARQSRNGKQMTPVEIFRLYRADAQKLGITETTVRGWITAVRTGRALLK